MTKDLRTYLAELEQHCPEATLRIGREVDPREFHVSAVLQHLEDRADQRIVLLFIEYALINPFEKRATAWRAVVQV